MSQMETEEILYKAVCKSEGRVEKELLLYKKETTSAPTFENNKYYQLLSSVELIPSWVLNTYYQKFHR